MIEQNTYKGAELELFSFAKNWKSYWFKEIKPLVGKSVLEVGAGIGETAKLFANQKIDRWIAIEPDIRLVKIIKENINISKYPTNYEIRPIKADQLFYYEKFDTILYIDVLEHIEDDRTELNNLLKHLNPDGRIIVLSPAYNFLYTNFDRSIGHYRRYNKKMLISIKPAKLQLEKLYYLDSVGMFASLGNKLFLKSAYPTIKQIQFWDKFLVQLSKLIDKIIFNKFGKSIIGVYKFEDR